jgi:hypothetical protein
MRLYTPAQMRGLFELGGLIVDKVQRSLKFDAWGKPFLRMVTVGRKRDSGAD